MNQHSDEEYPPLPPDLQGHPQFYVHDECGGETGMPVEVMRNYLRNPHYYRSRDTFCAHCRRQVPERECQWADTGENLADYFEALRRAAPKPPRRAARWVWIPILGFFGFIAAGVAWNAVAKLFPALKGGAAARPNPAILPEVRAPRRPPGFDPDRFPGRPPRRELLDVPGRPPIGRN